MGEGLYANTEGRTVYVEPFDDLDSFNEIDHLVAWHDLEHTLTASVSNTWERLTSSWKRTGERIVLRNGLHAIWLHHDSYDRVHVTFGVRSDLDSTEALAWAAMPDRAEAFFDRLAQSYDLRVRTSPWTSTARVARSQGQTP